jgi:glycosyltransferase involved in cell wall biosynthesis
MASDINLGHFLFLVNNFHPRVGGMETHVRLLAEELVRVGHRVTVVTLADTASRSEENGVRVVRLRRGFEFGTVISFPRWGTTRALIREFSNDDVSWISTHTRFFPLTWVGLGLGRATRTSVIHTEHGSGFVRGVNPLIGLVSRAVDISIGRWALRSADHVLGVSEDVVAFVRRLARVDASVFYNAIPDRLGSESSRYGLRPRLTFVGRLVPGKGADRLLRAASILISSHPGLVESIVIMGDGPERARLEHIVEQRGLSGLVTFTGRIASTAVAGELERTVFVNPTTLAEGFQTTLLEALAVGARIVTFNVPGAHLLREQGAPLVIVESKTDRALAAAMVTALQKPHQAFPMKSLAGWRWSARATQFVEVATTVSRPD